MLLLTMLVFTFQYLALFAIAVATPPLIRLAQDFLAPPRHRSVLIDPAANRRTKFIAAVVTATAIGLGFASPFIAGLLVPVQDADARQGIMYQWF